MRLLRLPNGKPPRMDMWGHNPFTVRRPGVGLRPARSLGDVSDMPRVLARLKRHVSRPLRRTLPIFISEFCIASGENDLFPLDLTRRQQADWLKRAFAVVRRERLVWGFGWFLLQDHRRADGHAQDVTCGLLDRRGKPKPAYTMFKRLSTKRPARSRGR
jgi:hypothetical protein